MTKQDEQKAELQAALEAIGTSVNNIRADVVNLQAAAQAVKEAPPDERDAALDALIETARGIATKADEVDAMNPATADGAGSNSDLPVDTEATTQ